MELRNIANSNVSVLRPKRDSVSEANEKQSDYAAKVHQRRLIFIGALFAIVILLFGSQIILSQRQYSQTNQEVVVGQKKLDKQKATQKDLKIQLNQLQDTNYLEKYVRDKYMYTKPGEQVYNLPVNDTAVQK
ncbi:FtsB family cell division protein [Companilactobacillus ginsenosidimutans]|uniref:FtsB family cell division protein n=1 Tax=Companilactobacillus ginsenosidimutans TaxID=1007676 RepID=UPI00065FECF3|nr:septum formation initiator family protein [Companilactobacillus ginsenosidimutans]